MNHQTHTFLRKFGRLLVFFLLVLFASAAGYLLVQRVFAITTIEVAGSSIRVVIDEKKLPRNLLFFPHQVVRDALKEQNPLLADILIQKKYPHTLVIIPVIRTPVARLVTADRRVLLDADAVVLGEDDGTSSLPAVELPVVGVRLGASPQEQNVKQSVQFLVKTKPLLAFKKITQLEDRYLQAESEEIHIFFTQDGNIDTIVATLQTLISGFRIKGTLPALIDLRFDKPVVTF